MVTDIGEERIEEMRKMRKSKNTIEGVEFYCKKVLEALDFSV